MSFSNRSEKWQDGCPSCISGSNKRDISTLTCKVGYLNFCDFVLNFHCLLNCLYAILSTLAEENAKNSYDIETNNEADKKNLNFIEYE